MVQSVKAAVGPTCPGKPVELVWETHHFSVYPQALQSYEHLLALFDWAAQIHFIMNYQGRRFCIPNVFNRGMIPIFLKIFERRFVRENLLKSPIEIA